MSIVIAQSEQQSHTDTEILFVFAIVSVICCISLICICFCLVYFIRYVGFGKEGVRSGSFAASIMDPNTSKGSYFAYAQSVGATGYYV